MTDHDRRSASRLRPPAWARHTAEGNASNRAQRRFPSTSGVPAIEGGSMPPPTRPRSRVPRTFASSISPRLSDVCDFCACHRQQHIAHGRRYVDEVEEKVAKAFGEHPFSIEGREDRNWILMDYGSVVVHLHPLSARGVLPPRGSSGAMLPLSRGIPTYRHTVSAKGQAIVPALSHIRSVFCSSLAISGGRAWRSVSGHNAEIGRAVLAPTVLSPAAERRIAVLFTTQSRRCLRRRCG